MAPHQLSLERPAGLSASDAGLLHLAQHALQAWAGLASQPAGPLTGPPVTGLICVATPVPGRFGLVSVAASPALGAALAVAATGDPHASDFSSEALHEFCRLIAERVGGAEAPGMPAPLRLRGDAWPEATPRAAAALDVGGYRLELRAWGQGPG